MAALAAAACGCGEESTVEDGAKTCGNDVCDFPDDCMMCREECPAATCGSCNNDRCDPDDCMTCPAECPGGECSKSCDDPECNEPDDCVMCPEQCPEKGACPGASCFATPGCDFPQDCEMCAEQCGRQCREACEDDVCDTSFDCEYCDLGASACPELWCTDQNCRNTCGNGTCERPFDCQCGCPEGCPLGVCQCGNGECDAPADCMDGCPEECPPEACVLPDAGGDGGDGGPPDGDASRDATIDAPDMGAPCEDLVASYLLNETEGLDIADETGTYPGALNGDPGADPPDFALGETGPAGYGAAVAFQGGWAQMDGLTTLPEVFTLELVFRPDANGDFLEWKNAGVADNEGLLLRYADGLVLMHLCGGDECFGLSFNGGPTRVAAGEWTYLAVVRTGGFKRMYLSDPLLETAERQFVSAMDSSADLTVDQGLRFGRVETGDFAGAVAWVRIRACAASVGLEFAVPSGEE